MRKTDNGPLSPGSVFSEPVTPRNTSSEAGKPTPDAEQAAPLRAIIVYDEQPAYERVLRTFADLEQRAGGGLDIRLIPLQLGQFNLPDGQLLALTEAQTADLFFLSVTSATALPETLRQWMGHCARRRQGCSTLLVVALLGRTGAMDSPESARFLFAKESVDHAGFDFLAPTSSASATAAVLAHQDHVS